MNQVNNIKLLLQIITCVVVLSAITSCGQRGDLYYPQSTPMSAQKNISTNTPQLNTVTTSIYTQGMKTQTTIEVSPSVLQHQ